MVSKRILRTAHRAVLASVAMAACGAGAASPDSEGILVAGNYTGTRAWVANQCGPNTPLDPLQLTVTHTRAATTASLNDGNATFPGTLAPDGAFAITPIAGTLTGGTAFAMTMAGRFSRTGVTLRQHVTEHRAAGDCSYDIDWTATKTGAPNDIP